MPTPLRCAAISLAAALAMLLSGAAPAVPPEMTAPAPASEPMEAPEASPAVAAAIEAPYLTPDEARDLRVFFGRATEADLDTPARRAQWALAGGAFLDAALEDPQAPLLDRADALLARGRPEDAARAVENDQSMRAVRIRTSAYEQLGRFELAAASALAAQAFLAGPASDSAGEIAEAARAVAIVTRLRPPVGAPGEEHKALMSALQRARENVDRLAWPVYLAEAELLYEKDNSTQAQQALQQVLAMNPRCAAAWALLGRMAGDAFDMGAVEAIAARLDLLAGAVQTEAEGVGDEPGAVPFEPAAASPLAAEIRIRAMLRQNDPDAAEALSRGAAAAYPQRRALVEKLAAVAALRFDPVVLREALAACEALSPNSGRGLYEAGRALSEARQYAQAADLLRQAAASMPQWPQPLIDLGLLYIQSGEDDLAFNALSTACGMDPFNVRADNSLKLVREVRTYVRVESEHFIVRCKGVDPGAKLPPGTPSADEVLAREMLAVLEENHRLVTGSPEVTDGGLDYSPPGKTFIDLMPNHRWFAVRIAGMPRIHTIAASTGPVIAMEAPRDGLSHTGTYDWPRVIRHEYTHTVGLGKTGNRLPHWFTEAQSVYLEHAPRDEDTCRLLARTLEHDDLFDFVGINAAFVRPKKPTDRQLAYAQGHWMYEYLVETHGERAPLALMDLYAQGIREEEAYQRVLKVSREQFMAAFKPWARAQVRSWGLDLPEGTPPLREILLGALAPGDAADAPPEGAEAAEPVEPDADALPPERLEALLAQHPAHPDLLELAVRRALAATNNTPTPEMAPLLERYAAARPVASLPHKTLARLYLSLPEPAPTEAGPSPRDAIPHLEWLDAREDKSPVFASQLGALYAVAGDLDKAWAKAQRATRIAPYDARYREKAAAIALQRGDSAGALAHIQAMIILEPDRPIHQQRLDALRKRLGG